MGLNANESKNAGNSSGLTAPTLEPGAYPARVVVIADLGLQPQRPYQGEEKPPAFEILVTYELLDEYMLDEDDEPDLTKPRWVSENFPLYPLSSERAKSTKRYLSIDPNNVFEGDWSRLLNTPVMVTLVNNPGKGSHAGKVFTNVSNVAPMRSKEADKASELVNPAVMFDMDNPDMESFMGLPEWVRTRIIGSLEYKGSATQAMIESKGSDDTPSEAAPADDDNENENPY